MVFDFAFVLVVLAAFTGVVWGLDAWLFRRKRAAAGLKEPVLVDYSRSFFPVILFVLVLRSFLYEPFRIPSDSMMPTLIEGDFIFVNKWTYGLKLPVINTKVVPIGEPVRGDVIVFRKPSEPSITFIKRLVGVPGDRIAVTERGLLVNGQPVPFEPEAIYRGPKEAQYPYTVAGTEQLGEQRHRIMLDPVRPSALGEWEVPSGHYFFMGDNRNNSRDSRFPEVGLVPERNLVGKAVAIWLSFNPDPGAWLLWDRMATRIE